MIEKIIDAGTMPRLLEEFIDVLLTGARVIRINELSLKICHLALRIIKQTSAQEAMAFLEVAIH